MAIPSNMAPLKCAYLEGLAIHPSTDLTEGASVTAKTGAPMVISSGLVVEATSGAGVTAVIGLYEQNGQNVASPPNLGRIIPALDHVVFEGNLDATTSNDPAGTHALAQTDVGLQYGLQKSTTLGYWYVNFSDTTNKAVTIVALRDAIGTVAGRVYFKFKRSVTWIN